MAPDAWPGLGLALLGLGLYLPGWEIILDWQSMLVLAAYLLLLLRNSAWPGFAWLGVLVLTWAGVAAGIALTSSLYGLSAGYVDRLGRRDAGMGQSVITGRAWWQRYGERIAAWAELAVYRIAGAVTDRAFSLSPSGYSCCSPGICWDCCFPGGKRRRS